MYHTAMCVSSYFSTAIRYLLCLGAFFFPIVHIFYTCWYKKLNGQEKKCQNNKKKAQWLYLAYLHVYLYIYMTTPVHVLIKMMMSLGGSSFDIVYVQNSGSASMSTSSLLCYQPICSVLLICKWSFPMCCSLWCNMLVRVPSESLHPPPCRHRDRSPSPMRGYLIPSPLPTRRTRTCSAWDTHIHTHTDTHTYTHGHVQTIASHGMK